MVNVVWSKINHSGSPRTSFQCLQLGIPSAHSLLLVFHSTRPARSSLICPANAAVMRWNSTRSPSRAHWGWHSKRVSRVQEDRWVETSSEWVTSISDRASSKTGTCQCLKCPVPDACWFAYGVEDAACMWCPEAWDEDISKSSGISPKEVSLEVEAGRIISKCLVECGS